MIYLLETIPTYYYLVCSVIVIFRVQTVLILFPELWRTSAGIEDLMHAKLVLL